MALAGDWTQVDIRIADLSGGILAKTQGETLYIDTTAAGYGWFIDPTPTDNSEFEEVLGANHLAAGLESPALGRIDLLTVVMHELGHVLGFDHTDALESGSPDVMNDVLDIGMRLLATPTTGPLEASPESLDPALLLADGATLNEVIDALLANNFDPSVPIDPLDTFEFTTTDPDVPDIISVGQNPLGADLELENVTLTFSLLSYNSNRWDGLVGIEAPDATLFPDGLGIDITDDENDIDLNAVVGTIDLSLGSDNVLGVRLPRCGSPWLARLARH